MCFDECDLCGKLQIGFDLIPIEDRPGRWKCAKGCAVNAALASLAKLNKGEPPPEIKVTPNVAANFGFNHPEDGSEQRYLDRRSETPWTRHTFWWVVHNAVAHVLIAFVPVRLFFRFHDWTSRKLHSK